MTFIKNFFHRLFADIKQNHTALGFILLYIAVAQLLFHSVCPVAVFLGIPCPACGLTRAGLFLITGHFMKAWAMNPSIFVVVPFFLYLLFYRYGRNCKPPFLTASAVGIGLLTVAVYVIRAINQELPSVPVGILPQLLNMHTS